MSKACLVCRGVGDFDEYMVHNKNGFLVNRDNFVNEAFQIIKSTYQQENFLKEIGKSLHEDILRLFDVNNVINEYDILLKNKRQQYEL